MRVAVLICAMLATPVMAADCPSPAGWTKPARYLAGRSPDLKFALAVGGTAQLTLREPRRVTLAGPAGRSAKPGTSSGMAALDVPKAGTLDVILSNASYVDLFRDGTALKSTGHSDLVTCPGFRKLVRFDVVPGRYVVQLTGAPERTVKLATVLR